MIETLRARLAWHPEWWAAALCVAAWAAIAAQSALPSSAMTFCGVPSGAAAFAGSPIAAGAAALAGWLTMAAAMMLPLVLPGARRAAFASLWRRRHRAIAGFLLGYAAVWATVGAAGIAVLLAVRPGPAATIAPAALAFAAAAVWEMTPLKRRVLCGCQRTVPLRPLGWSADIDCLRYGAVHGRSCLASCWAMMLGATLAPYQLPMMAVVAAVSAAQRYWPRRDQRAEAAVLAALALGCAVAAVRSAG